MKQLFALVILMLLLSCGGSKDTSQRISLKNYAEEAMSKSLIGNDPIIVGNRYSAKIYSKINLSHPYWNNLKPEDLIIIPKNTDLTEKFWSENGKKNGAIVYKNACVTNADIKKLKYVLNGKEIARAVADTLNMNEIRDFIVLETRDTKECVAFINTK